MPALSAVGRKKARREIRGARFWGTSGSAEVPTVWRKETTPLVLVVRQTPLHAGHLAPGALAGIRRFASCHIAISDGFKKMTNLGEPFGHLVESGHCQQENAGVVFPGDDRRQIAKDPDRVTPLDARTAVEQKFHRFEALSTV
jgi:hypothetical protein